MPLGLALENLVVGSDTCSEFTWKKQKSLGGFHRQSEHRLIIDYSLELWSKTMHMYNTWTDCDMVGPFIFIIKSAYK